MKGRIGDELRLWYILDAIREIENYTQNVSMHQFVNNSMMHYACIKQLEILGEAAHDVTMETKNKFPDIHWSLIIGMRNILVHENYGVDAELIWQVIQIDIPIIKMKFERMKSMFGPH